MTKLEQELDNLENTLGYYTQEVNEFTKLLDDIKCNYNVDIFELYIYRLEGDLEQARIMQDYYKYNVRKFLEIHPELD